MIEVKGKYNTATIFTDNIEEAAYSQVLNLMNQKFAEGSKFAIMPDCHAGAGCVIGLTMKVVDKVVPNLVGVDIGCRLFPGLSTTITKHKDADGLLIAEWARREGL